MSLEDILGKKGAGKLREEFGELLEKVRIVGWKDLRPWNEFFGVFKLPQINNIRQRITTNLLHYRTNYLYICGIVFALQLLFHPFVLLSLVLIIAASAYSLLIVTKPIIISKDIVINKQVKQILTAVLSFIFLGLTGALEKILWGLIYCFILCLAHLCFRPRSVTSKANKLSEEMKLAGFTWFGGAEGASLKGSKDEDDPENPNAPTFASSSNLQGDGMRKRAANAHDD